MAEMDAIIEEELEKHEFKLETAFPGIGHHRMCQYMSKVECSACGQSFDVIIDKADIRAWPSWWHDWAMRESARMSVRCGQCGIRFCR
jgi:hypothetical protein